MKPIALAIVIAGLAVASQANAATLLTNGTFESVTAGVPTGWTVSPGAPIFDLKGSDYIPCCGVTGSAADLANHFASFGPGNVANTGSLSQSFLTTAGKQYALTFDAGALGGGVENLVAAVFTTTGHLLAKVTLTLRANDDLTQTFLPDTLDFTATTGGSKVMFSAVGAGTNIDPVLDNVSVSAVPEAATWAMMLLGFGAIGWTLRASRRQSSATLAG